MYNKITNRQRIQLINLLSSGYKLLNAFSNAKDS